MKKLLAAFALLLVPTVAFAHHGGVTLAFGPGSPMDTNSPITLPEGAVVTGVRVEQVAWQKVHDPEDKSSFTFMNANLSYGFTPALSGTLVLPYYIKRTDDSGENSGMADIKFQLTYGFHYDPVTGFSRNTASDSAISMDSQKNRTWLGLSAMMSIPNGNDSKALDDGTVDPGMQTGFGAPSYTFGLTAARVFGPMTLNGELSTDFFESKMFDSKTDGDKNFQFGSELRGNLAAVSELYSNDSNFVSKIDGILELNYLHLERDKEDGKGQEATGGNMVYLSPGFRFSMPSLQNANFGLMVKVPIWKDLNEQSQQQGAEGLEKYRLISTLSFYF